MSRSRILLIKQEPTEGTKMTTSTLTIYVSAYGGWNWDKTASSGTKVTFTRDAAAAAYVRNHGHLSIWHDEEAAGDWDAFPETLAALHPTCEHGMSAALCMGPMHFPSAEQERQMGW